MRDVQMIERVQIDNSWMLQQLKEHGLNSASYLTLDTDLAHFKGNDNCGFIAYKPLHQTSVVVGDPICNKKNMPLLLHDFKQYCNSRSWSICFFMAKKELMEIYEGSGFGKVYIGSEAVIDLATFTLSGNKMQNVRRGINHAKRCNISISECEDYKNATGNISEKIYSECQEITQDWLETRATPELAFFISKLPERPAEDCKYYLATSERGIEAFALCIPIYSTNSYYIDLIRRRCDAPNGTTELLITEIFERLKPQNIRSVYLGFVPFSNMEIGNDYNNPIHTKIMDLMYKDYLKFLYPASSSYFYKNKFRPRWEELYLYYYPALSYRMIYAIFRAFLPQGLRGVFHQKLGKQSIAR